MKSLNSNPEVRLQFFEAFGLSALPGLYGRMDAFETTQQGMLDTQREMLDTQRATQQTIQGMLDTQRATQQTIQGMLDTQREILDTLKQHSEMLERHSETLERHSETLERQGKTLERHSEILEQQSKLLMEHSEALRALRQDVTVLKDDSHVFRSLVMGERLENKAANVVRSRLSAFASSKLRRINLKYSSLLSLQPNNRSYLHPVEDAYADGAIPHHKYARLTATDLVFSAKIRVGGQWERRWFPVEVSNTIHRDDVDRALQTADFIKSVFDEEVEAVIVAGTEISDKMREYAEDYKVEVATFQL